VFIPRILYSTTVHIYYLHFALNFATFCLFYLHKISVNSYARKNLPLLQKRTSQPWLGLPVLANRWAFAVSSPGQQLLFEI